MLSDRFGSGLGGYANGRGLSFYFLLLDLLVRAWVGWLRQRQGTFCGLLLDLSGLGSGWVVTPTAGDCRSTFFLNSRLACVTAFSVFRLVG